MAKSTPEPIVSDSADETIALQMARWLSHLGSERRLSPKTLEAYVSIFCASILAPG
jgi:integrase/recombinase XerC